METKTVERENDRNLARALVERKLLTLQQAKGLLARLKNGDSDKSLEGLLLNDEILAEEVVLEAKASLWNVPFIDLKLQYKSIQTEIDSAINQVLEKGAFVQGPCLEQFEKDYSEYLGVKHVIGVNSGTSALAISLMALSEINNWQK